MAHPFERLHAWQVGYQLALRVYQVTNSFPKDERYGITAQMRRAAMSVPANLAEGASTASKREFARFVAIARKSNNEIAFWLRASRDLGYLSTELWRGLDSATFTNGKVMWSLERRLRDG